VRFVLTAVLWLLATAALAVTLPVSWAQQNIVDADGYAAFAERAAGDPALRQAVAGELTTQIGRLATSNVAPAVIGAAATGYTAGDTFPAQFGQVNRFAHRWMFTNTVPTDVDPQGRWVVDLAPMLDDRSLRETLSSYDIEVPSTLTVPLTENAPAALRPGVLRSLATWGPLVRTGAVMLTTVLALLTILVARRRGKAIAALGVSALLVGAAGWAGLEVGRRYLDRHLVNLGSDIRQIADSMVGQAVSSMHDWLNITLAVGAGLVVLGIVLALLGGIGGRVVREPRGQR
jgi:hypothetical protein